MFYVLFHKNKKMRNIQFNERRSNTREISNIKIFGINEIEKHFNETLEHIQGQLNLADILQEKGKHIEAAEVLRSQIIFIESAYDFFLHEILVLGIFSFFTGAWNNKTDKYFKLELTMNVLESALSNNDDEWLKEWVTEKYSHVTLMDFDAFKNKVCALLGITVKEVANLAFYSFGEQLDTEKKLQIEIDSIYYRRNQIAHQSDRKIGTAQRENIDKVFILEKIRNIRKIILAVCEVVRIKDGISKQHGKIGNYIKDLRKDIIALLHYRIAVEQSTEARHNT